MKGIQKLAKQHGCYIIEDCVQAHGATINGKSVRSFGDIAAWSFYQDKIIATGGEGEMVTGSPVVNNVLRVVRVAPSLHQ
jgi:dTDP-4-amino-4,6-dideoxygalactose transaminase